MKNFLTPKNPKMCDPILVSLLKMRPNHIQSSRENATPSSSTSPLASQKEVPPPPPGGAFAKRSCISHLKKNKRKNTQKNCQLSRLHYFFFFFLQKGRFKGSQVWLKKKFFVHNVTRHATFAVARWSLEMSIDLATPLSKRNKQ